MQTFYYDSNSVIDKSDVNTLKEHCPPLPYHNLYKVKMTVHVFVNK